MSMRGPTRGRHRFAHHRSDFEYAEGKSHGELMVAIHKSVGKLSRQQKQTLETKALKVLRMGSLVGRKMDTSITLSHNYMVDMYSLMSGESRTALAFSSTFTLQSSETESSVSSNRQTTTNSSNRAVQNRKKSGCVFSSADANGGGMFRGRSGELASGEFEIPTGRIIETNKGSASYPTAPSIAMKLSAKKPKYLNTANMPRFAPSDR